MRDERRHVDLAFQPAKAWVRHEPLGVIGIISPWNYPLFLALGPLVDALAAGNRAMIKPSELTPRTSALLAEKIAESFDETEVTVITGDAGMAAAFSSLPFDHLVFTGSTAVGRKVMQAAAPNLTPVTLELGGKSPVILCDDYPVRKRRRAASPLANISMPARPALRPIMRWCPAPRSMNSPRRSSPRRGPNIRALRIIRLHLDHLAPPLRPAGWRHRGSPRLGGATVLQP
jgi:hypothetical protein